MLTVLLPLLGVGCSNVATPDAPKGDDGGAGVAQGRDASRPSDERDESDEAQRDEGREQDDATSNPTHTTPAMPSTVAPTMTAPTTPANGALSGAGPTAGEGGAGEALDDTSPADDSSATDEPTGQGPTDPEQTDPSQTSDDTSNGDGSLDAGSDDAPTNDGGSAAPGSDAEIPEGYVKGIIGVGYGGLRIVSRDGGQTWGSRAYSAASGGDDEDLLRAVAYGKGRWIATGWKLMISDDGVQWSDLGMLQDGIMEHNPIIEGLAYHAGYFYAAGDGEPSRVYRSNDGVEWETYAEIGETVKHTGLTYRGGLFVSYGDSETSYQSENGLDWMELDGLSSATYCEGEYRDFSACHESAWFDDGFYLFPEWGGEIRRSTNGEDFETVYRDDQDNTLYRARAVAEGYVIPE